MFNRKSRLNKQNLNKLISIFLFKQNVLELVYKKL